MPTEARNPDRPAPRRRLSRTGLELIKSFEGFRRRSARLPGGRYVVGYGHIRSAREGVEVSESDGEALLRYDLLPVEAAVNEWAFAPLTQNQFDALVSFAFNIGVKTFRRSDVLRRINEGAYLQAAGALEMWRRADLDGEGVIVDALVRRRAAEKALFLKPAQGHIPAPSAVLKPQVDFTAYRTLPRRRPEEVATPLDGDDAVVLRPAPDSRPASESDWSPTQAAAANVTARLSELLGDDEADVAAEAEPELPGLSELDFDPADDPLDPADLNLADADLDPANLLDGDFMQAPPSPPEAEDEDDLSDELASETPAAEETAADEDAPDETFPELDLEPALAFSPGIAVDTEDEDEDAPVVDLAELPPFPEDAPLPPHIAPEAQARFDDQFEPEPQPNAPPTPGPDSEETWGQTSSAEPSQGDPAALARAEEGPDNGPYIYLFLAALALVVAAAVTFFRTPETGAAPGGSGLGWVLGLLGVAGVAGALWAIMGREDAIGDDEGEEDAA